MQTPGLAFTGADGRSYTFRWIDKDPSRLLPEEWRETAVADYVKDQTAASHPGNWPVLMGLAEEIGFFPFTPQRLMVMPDDPALGEHRELFAGSIGSFGEYPMPAHDGVPGFMGATEIISSKDLWNRWREGPKNRIDSQIFVRQRIMNLWTGNWDRHRSQWRWAWVPDKDLWVPIPEDPDQAFSNYGGLLISVARWTVPILLSFEDEISGMEGAVRNGADVDRWLLSDLDREDFREAARQVQSLLTDEVIDAAVGKLPPEWYELNGELLARRLKNRRDNIPEATERYYEFLAGEVNVHATNVDEVARIRRFDDGAVEVTVAAADASAEPYYQRRFDPEETRSVRLYLHGGHDRAESEGPADGTITVQVLGGAGDDTLDDSRSGRSSTTARGRTRGRTGTPPGSSRETTTRPGWGTRCCGGSPTSASSPGAGSRAGRSASGSTRSPTRTPCPPATRPSGSHSASATTARSGARTPTSSPRCGPWPRGSTACTSSASGTTPRTSRRGTSTRSTRPSTGSPRP
jgi:hypothetical protein